MSHETPSARDIVWAVGAAGVRVTLDPEPSLRDGKRTAPYHMTHFTYEPLTSPTVASRPDGVRQSFADRLLPRLALSWEASEDYTVWTIRLRPGVRSAAGNVFSAADVKWAWDRTFALRGVGLWRSRRMAGVATAADVTVIDGLTVQFRLSGTNPEFPQYFVFATNNVVDSVAAQAHATDDDPWALGYLAKNAAGFGAFALDAWTDRDITFRAREEYWAGRPGIDTVRLTAVDRREQALRMLEDGSANFCGGLFGHELAQFEHRPEFTVWSVQANHSTLEFNWRTAPFDDQKVRQAIAYALPYERIIAEVYGGRADISRSPIGPTCKNYVPDAYGYGTDLGTARRLLAESSHAGGFQTKLAIKPAREAQAFGEIARDALAEIGIVVELAPDESFTPDNPPSLWFKEECGHALSEAMYDLGHDYDPPLGMWPGRFAKDGRFTEPLRGIRLSPSSEHPRLYRNLQQTILEFAPCVHIAELQAGCVVRNPVDPWAFGVNSLGLTSTVWTGDRQLLPAE